MTENRKRVLRPFPNHSIEKSLGIARAICENNAGRPMDRLLVADTIGRKPTSSEYKLLLSSSYKYGLTEGTEKADSISLTELGKKIVQPMDEDESRKALVQAICIPVLLNKIYLHFNRAKLPQGSFLKNVLERQFGVDSEHSEELGLLLTENAKFAGILVSISGSEMIMLNQAGAKITNIKNASLSNDSESDKIDDEVEMPEKRSDEKKDKDTKIQKPSGSEDEKIRRVFITHGKNKEFVEPIKQLLKFGELEAVVAVDNQSVSKPVSAKVMDDMRSCKAAIIHVDEERRLMDTEGKEHIILNNNVLIEIGAAMALYGGRYILLVKDGITLPTNLQGLYQVRYTGNKLDGDATINLMKAINSMKQDKLEAAA